MQASNAGATRVLVEDADMELRDAIQRIAVEWPCYGSRRIRGSYGGAARE